MKNCNQCGKCCIKYGGGDLAVTQDEIELWEIFNPEIYQYVKDNKIWFDPETGEQYTRCPFLEVAPQSDLNAKAMYTCSIYLNRPEDCRHYPSMLSEMIRDECEMIELSDLENPEKAKAKLEILMKDSHHS